MLVHQGIAKSKVNQVQKTITRNIIVCLSLFNGFMFGYLYKETMLSALVAPELEKPINTPKDMLSSGLTLYYPAKTAMAKALFAYNSPEMKTIMKNQAAPYNFSSRIPTWVEKL